MERDANAYVFDIVGNANKILEFVAGSDLNAYRSNDIGEAQTKLKALDLPAFGNIPDSTRIVGFRNVLAHGYE